MPKNKPKLKTPKKNETLAVPPGVFLPPALVIPPPRPSDSDVPASEAFLEQARKEPVRKLISDHTETIVVLRNEKRFTFRAIAEWLNERGIEADHSVVYRIYQAAVPQEERDQREPWDKEP